MSTIIKRAVTALKESGHEATADELLALAGNLRDTTLRLLDNYKKQAFLMRQLISVIQARCPHHEWYLGALNDELNPGTWGPEDTIVCHNCGHTVCDERAFAFGKRVRQGDYFIYSKANGRRFALSADLRKRLGDKLNAKEIKGEYCEERAGDTGKGTGNGETAGGTGETTGVLEGASESEGRAVGGDG